MNIYKSRIFIVMVMAALLLAACGSGGDKESTKASGGGAEKTYELKLGHIAPPDHIWNKAAEKLGEELEKRSNGRMKVDLYPGGQLGSDSDMVQQLETGSLDIAFITNAFLTSKSDAFSAWFAPYLFGSYEEAFEASNSDVAKKILATLDDQGLKAMDYFFSGHRTMMFREKIETPDEMKGLTLRVTPSPALEDWYRSLGVNPESISLPDVYQSAQTGVIDGMEMDLDAAITSNFNEVTGYGALTNHMVWPAVMIINKKRFEDMSEDDQKIIKESMAVASEYATMQRASQEEEFKKTLEDRGMELYEIDTALFKPHMKEFDKKYKEMDPLIKEFIETFRK